MLHYVSDDTSLDDLKPWVINRQSFIRLLDYLEAEGYTTVDFEDVKSGNTPKRSVILTFDDCPKHLWDFAIPEMQKRNMKGVFYLPTAQLDSYNKWNVVEGLSRVELMSTQDVEKLIEIGMEVGSHAHNHIMLEEYPAEQVDNQLNKSKIILEQITKRPVISVAYPYGSLPKGYKRTVSEAGYDFGIGVDVRNETKYSLRRWTYTDEDTVESIKWKMSYAYRIWRVYRDNYEYIKYRTFGWLYNRYASVKKLFINKMLVFYSFDFALEVDACDFVFFCEV